MELYKKKVAVIGLGVSNVHLIRFLFTQGAVVTACDKKQEHELKDILAELAGIPLSLQLGENYLQGLPEFDVVFLTPGMKRDFPELIEARKKGVVFSSEMKEFLSRCPGKIIGITGSSGKTTTTTLAGKIMQETGRQVFIGGNIGNPLITKLPEMNKDTWVVLELSSFQLQEAERSPNIAAVTNITPNHLDMHASMEEYIDAKKNIYRFQNENDYLILNYDYDITRTMAGEARGKVFFFSRKAEISCGACLQGEDLLLKIDGKIVKICRRKDLKLLGLHNIENVLLASLITFLAGADLSHIQKVVTAFTGVEHRLELVREYNGVVYYNDSISTTPARATAGVLAMERPVVLIVGGYDKKLSFDEFAEVVVEKCKAVVTLGQTAPLLEEAIARAAAGKGKSIPVYRQDTFHRAIEKAKELAQPGDAVLLSPACASYDMFRDYRQRGELFKQIIQEFA